MLQLSACLGRAARPTGLAVRAGSAPRLGPDI